MRRLVMTALNRLELEDSAAKPELSGDSVLIRVEGAGLGLPHAQLLTGLASTAGLPRVLGHEIVGRVEATSGRASVEAGELVVVNPVTFCGQCHSCLTGHETVCPERRLIGYELDGGYADYVVVPYRQVFQLPSATPIEEAIMLAAALPTAVRAVRRASVRLGAHVIVLGLGSVGMLVCQLLRTVGAARVVGADINRTRLEECRRWIDSAVDLGTQSTDEAAAELRRESSGAEVVFETAGKKTTLDLALQVVDPGGTVLCVGAIDGSHTITFADYVRDLLSRELTIRSTYAYAPLDFETGLRLHRMRRVVLSPLVGNSVGLHEVADVIREIVQEGGPQGKRHVVRLTP